MTKPRKCRAKHPEYCPHHGRNSLGVRAEANIKRVLPQGSRYRVSYKRRAVAPMKLMSAPQLALTISQFAKRTDSLDQAKVDEAILFAAHVHRKHSRANRGDQPYTPYIEHPLRNTLRLIRYGCTDQDILIASLFHDTVEDGPEIIAKQYAGVKATDEAEAREIALDYIGHEYGPRVQRIVYGMSNPIAQPGRSVEQKNREYAEHVLEALEDPDVALDKISDLIDNGASLHHTLTGMKPEAIKGRAIKYLGVWDAAEARLKRDEKERKLAISDEGLRDMQRNLRDGRIRLDVLSRIPTL